MRGAIQSTKKTGSTKGSIFVPRSLCVAPLRIQQGPFDPKCSRPLNYMYVLEWIRSKGDSSSFLKHNVGPLAGVGIRKVVNGIYDQACVARRRHVQAVQKRNACCVGKAVLFFWWWFARLAAEARFFCGSGWFTGWWAGLDGAWDVDLL